MTMFAHFKSIFRWRKADESRPPLAADASIGPSPKTRKRSFDKVSQYLENGTIGDERTRSGSEPPTEMSSPKRVKLAGGGYKEQEPDNRSESSRTSPPDSSAGDKGKGKAADRRLMPPPAIPKSRQPRRKVAQTRSPRTPRAKPAEDDDTRSLKSEQTTTSSRRRPEGMDAFEAERARRYADACTLPANSGIWSAGEHQLFIHLAMRGYEPLLPNNWMRDFKTLPLALFAHQPDDTPLIHPMPDTEFRAIRALRDLFETGKLIRDKILSSPGFNVETTLQRALMKYIEWSMNDAGIPQTQSTLPVHRIAIRKKGQKTSDLINDLESGLYELAQQHRDEKGIIMHSIETPQSSPIVNSGMPSVQDDSDPDTLPTLTGLMITYGILVLFTFNPNIKKIKTEPTGDTTSPDPDPDDDEMGIRYIARFDFSDSSMDVWNAFSVAIVCMMLRKTLVERGVEITDSMEKEKGKGKGKGKGKRKRGEGKEFDPDV